MGPVVLLGVYVAILKDSASWTPTVISGIILLVYILGLARARLILSTDCVRYRYLFDRGTIGLKEIVSAKQVMGFSGYKPFLRVVLVLQSGHGEKEKILNAGPFDTRETKRWVDSLNARLRIGS